MCATDHPTAAQTGILGRQSEQASLDELAERLAVRFPHVSAERITHAIRLRHDSFHGSLIRDFIHVLVERAVSADLTNLEDLGSLADSPTRR